MTVMNGFDEFLDKAKALAAAAGKKTGEVVEVSKLKIQAVQINSDIQKAYERLGSIQYEKEKTGADNSDLVKVCISEIDALLAELADLNERIADTKSAARCPNCGAQNPEEAIFCARCGSSLTADSAPQYGKAVEVDPDLPSDEEEE